MDKEIKRLVTGNVVEDLTGTQDLELGSSEHKAAVSTTETQVKIINESERIEVENELTRAKIRDLEERRAMDYELESKKIEIDRKDRKVKNFWTGVKVVGGIVVTGITTLLYMTYDHTGNIPSQGAKKAIDRFEKEFEKNR